MKGLICWAIGHKYFHIQRLSDQSHLLGCERCKRKFAINTSVRTILDWDLELADFYASLLKSKAEGPPQAAPKGEAP